MADGTIAAWPFAGSWCARPAHSEDTGESGATALSCSPGYGESSGEPDSFDSLPGIEPENRSRGQETSGPVSRPSLRTV